MCSSRDPQASICAWLGDAPEKLAAAFAATGGARAGADALEQLIDAAPADARHAVQHSSGAAE